jgi:hypothetical protein
MREAPSRRAAVIAALVLLFVALAPPLLFGESLGAFGLVLVSASLLGAGVLVRWGSSGRARTLGTALAMAGAIALALSLGFTALVLSGWGRGY